MTYLSRVMFNTARGNARKLLAEPKTVHGLLLAGVPNHELYGATGPRLLWRWESDPRRPSLLILTPVKPDWTHIVESAGWPNLLDETVMIRDYQPVLDRVETGARFAFRIVANPMRTTRHPRIPTDRFRADAEQARAAGRTVRPQLVPLHTRHEWREWLVSKSAGCGFEIPPAAVDQGPDESERDVAIRALDTLAINKQTRLRKVTFEGSLVVTDPQALRQALVSGIGRAKHLGCGFLTLAKLPTAPASRPGSTP